MSKTKVILLHAAFWLIAPMVVIPSMVRAGASNSVLYWITAYIFYISAFYVNYYLILPAWAKRRKIIPLLLKWFGLILLYTGAILLINRLFGMYQRGSYSFRFWDWFSTSASYMCVLYFLSFFYRFALDWFRNERVQRDLENSNLKIKLAFLKSQINPHFLLNTLNNIYSLAYQQSGQTATAILWLSEMMHYMLYDSSGEKVPLSKELRYVEQFISLQRLRMNSRMCFDLVVTGDVTRYQIAPLLFVNIVENIFKHAVLNDESDPAIMQLTLQERKLFLYSRNKINQKLKNDQPGIGLANVKGEWN